MLIPLTDIIIDRIEYDLLREKELTLQIGRLDKIHPEISGNKIFKLHYFVQDCMQTEHKTILTFGGAFSNHLAATSFLCKQNNLKSIGIIRGEEPKHISHTLAACRENGMDLRFISREEYRNISQNKFPELLKSKYGDCTVVPEGGYSPEGAKGASLIMDHIYDKSITHICTATGTATTLAGLLIKKEPHQEIISVPVLKNMSDINERICYLYPQSEVCYPVVFDEYHFGGYAKYTPELIDFMNKFYSDHHIPTDFVYTAKLLYAITDKIKKGYFKKGSKILCLHTGGLQGNKSLESGTFNF